eukprot:scaffold46160_cov42-Cyclotella_meneghiniana.AAC.3
MDKVIKNGMTAAAEDTESTVIERKSKRVVRESTGGIFSDSSTGTITSKPVKEEVLVEEASDEEVTLPDPPAHSSTRSEQPSVKTSTSDKDQSDEWEDVIEEECHASSKATKKKQSPKKSQANIKSMFQKQQQQ